MKQEPEGFDIFWSQIWRPHARHTDGRGLARETFAKLVKNGADPQDIIDGARCFFRTMKDRDKDYVPLSSTWLNREPYIDLAEQERTYQAAVNERRQRQASQSENVISISAERREELVREARAKIRGTG
jgi:hypothetical protein